MLNKNLVLSYIHVYFYVSLHCLFVVFSWLPSLNIVSSLNNCLSRWHGTEMYDKWSRQGLFTPSSWQAATSNSRTHQNHVDNHPDKCYFQQNALCYCQFLICEDELDSWNHVVVFQGQLVHSTSLSGIQDILHNRGAFQPSNNNHPALISCVDSKLMDMLMVTMNMLMVGPRWMAVVMVQGCYL